MKIAPAFLNTYGLWSRKRTSPCDCRENRLRVGWPETAMSTSGRSLPPRCALCSRAPAPGVNLLGDAERNYFPRPPDAAGAGRHSRRAHPRGRERLFGPLCQLVGDDDQLLKGAAHNAVQIAAAQRSGMRGRRSMRRKVARLPSVVPSINPLRLPASHGTVNRVAWVVPLTSCPWRCFPDRSKFWIANVPL